MYSAILDADQRVDFSSGDTVWIVGLDLLDDRRVMIQNESNGTMSVDPQLLLCLHGDEDASNCPVYLARVGPEPEGIRREWKR